jgi:peptide/nickel transport system substrate-binding protein
MRRDLRRFAAAGALLGTLSVGGTAFAQKQGGVLKIGQFDSPASMSIHEESSNTAEGPMMGVFNNLVLYDQHVAQNSLQSIRPDLATDWSWDEDRTRLTFHLRHGVKWHDGKPLTAQASNAPGTCSAVTRARSFALTPARRGTATFRRLPPTAITR